MKQLTLAQLAALTLNTIVLPGLEAHANNREPVTAESVARGTRALFDHLKNEGWQLQDHSGRNITSEDVTSGRVNDYMLLPSGDMRRADVGFRVRPTAQNGVVRVVVTAKNLKTNRVLSRRVLSIDPARGDASQVALAWEQTVQSMATEVSTELARTASIRKTSKTLVARVGNLLIPSAHADDVIIFTPPSEVTIRRTLRVIFCVSAPTALISFITWAIAASESSASVAIGARRVFILSVAAFVLIWGEQYITLGEANPFTPVR